MPDSFDSQYSLVLFGPRAAHLGRKLTDTLGSKLAAFGLKTDAVRVVFERGPQPSLSGTRPVAAVYFAGATYAHEDMALARILVQNDVYVLPVVDSLSDFTRKVPPALRAINGHSISGDPTLDSVANAVLDSFGLLRKHRAAFISYRRADTRAAAVQLYHALDEACWNTFLDTHSLPSGVDFQAGLWDRMSNADLLVFFDTPTSLSSEWVAEELARAHAWGMGVLQIVWPNHKRTKGTELCDVIQLKKDDVVGPLGPKARLAVPTLKRVVAGVEALRARSWAARYARLVRHFRFEMQAMAIATSIQSTGEILVKGAKRYRVLPVIGHVTSEDLHRAYLRAKRANEVPYVLYDGAGFLPRRRDHLAWLNGMMSVRTLQPHEVGELK